MQLVYFEKFIQSLIPQIKVQYMSIVIQINKNSCCIQTSDDGFQYINCTFQLDKKIVCDNINHFAITVVKVAGCGGLY